MERPVVFQNESARVSQVCKRDFSVMHDRREESRACVDIITLGHPEEVLVEVVADTLQLLRHNLVGLVRVGALNGLEVHELIDLVQDVLLAEVGCLVAVVPVEYSKHVGSSFKVLVTHHSVLLLVEHVRPTPDAGSVETAVEVGIEAHFGSLSQQLA